MWPDRARKCNPVSAPHWGAPTSRSKSPKGTRLNSPRDLPGLLRSSVPGRVADDEAFGVRRLGVPAGAGAGGVADRVPAQAGDHRVGVGGVGVDRDPAPGAGFAVGLEGAGGEGDVEQAGAVESEADRARAVVSVG